MPRSTWLIGVTCFLVTFYMSQHFFNSLLQLRQQQSYQESILVVETAADVTYTKDAAPAQHGATSQRNILLFTSYRSGSSFTGELFNQNPSVHYVFEPLKLMSLDPRNVQARSVHLQKRIHEYVIDAFQCNYTALMRDSHKFFNKSMTNPRNFWIKLMFRQTYEKSKLKFTKTEADMEKLEAVCRQYDIQVMKIIRCDHIDSIITLMINHDVDVIYLVRDPRAIAWSRYKIEGPKKPKQSDAKTMHASGVEFLVKNAKRICDSYLEALDFTQGAIMSKKRSLIQRKFVIVRYEDLAFNPEIMSQKLYKFLDLEYPTEIEDWIKNSTHENITSKATFDTKRNSREAAEKWRQQVPVTAVQAMQDVCQEAMEQFSYTLVRDEAHLLDTDQSLVEELNSHLRFTL